MLDAFCDYDFLTEVRRDTYANIRSLISIFDLVQPNPVQKNQLKNMGMWIGEITLKKNSPILLSEIDFKDLLVNSFVLDKLDMVLDFVC